MKRERPGNLTAYPSYMGSIFPTYESPFLLSMLIASYEL